MYHENMPTRKTPLITNEYYHIFNRGVNKQPIFFSKVDYKRTMSILNYYTYQNLPSYSKYLAMSDEHKAAASSHSPQQIVRVVCACLMPNHFHLLIQQVQDGGIVKFMSNFQNSLTKYVNTKNERSGHLLQGEFKSVHIEDNTQLLHVSRYIHLNPHTSFVVKNLHDLETYKWSSYPEYISGSNNELYDKDIILSQFKGDEDYKKFVNDQADYQQELDRIKHLLLEG